MNLTSDVFDLDGPARIVYLYRNNMKTTIQDKLSAHRQALMSLHDQLTSLGYVESAEMLKKVYRALDDVSDHISEEAAEHDLFTDGVVAS